MCLMSVDGAIKRLILLSDVDVVSSTPPPVIGFLGEHCLLKVFLMNFCVKSFFGLSDAI